MLRYVSHLFVNVFKIAASDSQQNDYLIYDSPAGPALFALWLLGTGLGLIAWGLMNPSGQDRQLKMIGAELLSEACSNRFGATLADAY